jgi:hypothetical protein
LRGSERALRLLPGRSPSQLLHILELLAQVTPFSTQSIEDLLVEQAPQLPWGASIVVVTAVAHEDLLATLMELASVGRRIVLITLAEEPPTQYLGNVAVYHLPHVVDDLIVPIPVTPTDGTVPASTPAKPPAGRLSKIMDDKIMNDHAPAGNAAAPDIVAEDRA